MWKNIILSFAIMFLIMGCGKSEFRINSPAPGSVYKVNGQNGESFGQFPVTIDKEDYDGVTINFQWTKPIVGQQGQELVRCMPQQNAPAYCMANSTNTYGGGSQYNYGVLVITASDGDYSDQITVIFEQGNAPGQYGTP